MQKHTNQGGGSRIRVTSSQCAGDQLLEWLQTWFRLHCDGNWEHSFGVRIDTLDNPGWVVEIDLAGTKLEGRSMESVDQSKGPDDWVRYEVKNKKFCGWGDPKKLIEILRSFQAWTEQGSD